MSDRACPALLCSSPEPALPPRLCMQGARELAAHGAGEGREPGWARGRGVFTPYASHLMRECASALQPPAWGALPALLVGGCGKPGLNTN